MSDENTPLHVFTESQDAGQTSSYNQNQAIGQDTKAEIETPKQGLSREAENGEGGISDEELRMRLIQELDQLVERLKALTPDYVPPPFSAESLLVLIRENLGRFSPATGWAVLERLRSTISEDLFDVDTWKGIWYVINYSIEQQTDLIKRRVAGEYETDEWGLDQEFVQVVEPFFKITCRT